MLSTKKDELSPDLAQGLSNNPIRETSCQQSSESSARSHWANLSSHIPSIDRTIDFLSHILFEKARTAAGKASKEQAMLDVKGEADNLFRGVLRAALPMLPDDGPIVLVIDNIFIPKTRPTAVPSLAGKKSAEPSLPKGKSSPYLRPWFTSGWCWGYLLFHAALDLGSSQRTENAFITVDLEPVPSCIARRKARHSKSIDEPNFFQAQTHSTLSSLDEIAYMAICRIRQWLDEAGLTERTLFVIGDTGCCNSRLVARLPHGTALTCRMRMDAIVRVAEGSSSGLLPSFGGEKLNLINLIKKSSIPPHLQTVRIGMNIHEYATKTIFNVQWPVGSRQTLLRVISALPRMRKGENHRHYKPLVNYFSTEHESSTELILEAHLRRRRIEGIHRELRQRLGLHGPRLKNPQAILGLQVALAVAISLMKIRNLRMNHNSNAIEI